MTQTLAPTTDAPTRSPTRLLAVLLVGQFMAILDATIVNVAMPTVQQDLGASGAALQLIVSGYTISYAVLLITGARLGTMYGRRQLFLLGLVGFTLTSLACGLAPNTATLVTSRFLQGVAAAAMVPQVISMINAQFEGAARMRAVGAYSAVIAVGFVAGQIIGGVLVSADLFGASWRPVFLVNAPVGVALAWLVLRWVPRDLPTDSRRLDVAGLLLVASAIGAVVVPLVLGHEEGWPAWTFIAMAAGVVLAAAFVLVERRVADPLLDLNVLRTSGLPAGLLTLAAGMIAYGGFIFSLTLHLQSGLGDTALRAGLTFAPSGVAFGLVSLTWRQLPEVVHHRLATLGLLVGGAAFVCVAADLHGGGRGGAWLLVFLAFTGLGLGTAFGSAAAHSLVNVPMRSAADASGLVTTTIQLGQVIGVAVFGSVFLTLATQTRANASAHAATVALGLSAGISVVGALIAIALGRAVLRARAA